MITLEKTKNNQKNRQTNKKQNNNKNKTYWTSDITRLRYCDIILIVVCINELLLMFGD